MMMQQPSAAGDDTVAQPGGGGSGRGRRGKRGGDGGGGGHRGRKAPADGAVGGGDETVMISQVRAQSDGDPTFLAVMDIDLPRGATVRLGAGEMFGEIGALSGWPQAVTARTAGACTLVQIRLPALRRLKEESPAFKERADRMYRERTLYFHLRRLPLLARCEEAVLDRLVEKVELVSLRPNKVLLEEGQPADALYVVRSGFLKLTQHFAAGEPAVSYLSKGMTLGEVEMMVDDIHGWTCTASSAGYCELVKIEKADVDAILQTHPETAQELWQSAVQRIKETGYAKRNLNHSELIEFSLKKGLVQGNSILVIDLNTCTRCDDCMRACADTHGGRPRFVREGERYGSHLIARSCYHCRDPHCLVGCPTGAIHRAAVGDVVEIQEDICIGCSNCANKCPYDAIIMHPTGETWPGNALPEFLRGTEQKVASKCDLCYTSADGPACVKNCPHGCAIRIGSVDEFTALSRASKNGN
jgi:Fe-S-cluster-containing dehydrogenase component/CRP-like cAMP-binding protein